MRHAFRLLSCPALRVCVLHYTQVVTWAALAPRMWVLNPCRALAPSTLESTPRACTVGYGTTRGHLLAGCERMTVRHCAADGSVYFEVVSASRGSGVLGRLLFPLLGPSQHRYFSEQVRCMQAIMVLDEQQQARDGDHGGKSNLKS